MKHSFCPYYLNKEVKDGFNEIIEALGGRPMTDEEFRNVELRKQRTGRDLTAMNAAYKIWELNKGNLIDLAPNGEPSILFDKYLKHFDYDRTRAIIAKAKVYSDKFINLFGDWVNDVDNASKVVDENGEPLSDAVPIVNLNKKQYIKPETTFSSITTEDGLMSAESKYEELNELVLSEEFKKLEARLDHIKGKGYNYIISKVLRDTYKYIYKQFKKALGKKGYELKFVRYDGNDSVYHVKRKESDSKTTAQKALEQPTKPLQNNVTTSVQPSTNFNRNIHYFMGDSLLMEQEQKDLDGFYELLYDKPLYNSSEEALIDYIQSEDDSQTNQRRQRRPYTRPETRVNLNFALRGDVMSLENPTADSPRQKTQDVIEENKKTQLTLINKIQSLYNQYRRMKGKSATKQRVQNAIFELNNKIRHLELQNTINEILNFITERVGYEDVSGNTLNPDTVLQYLKDQNTAGFANVDSSKLMDIYKNTILPIGSILQDIAQDDIFTECPGIDEAGRIAMNQIYDKCKAGLKKVTELWTEAMFVVSDRIVDDIIDKEVFLPEKESKEEMRDIVKDFLHKTLSTGDITSLDYFVGNFGRSRNPIVKQAFHLITATEAQTRRELVPMITKIVKAYQKADSIFKRADWLLTLMELDRKGRPTGNFVRPINYGLYELDLNNFIKDLNDKFDRAYGHHYFYDETNTFVNSATFEDASLEEWTYDANGNAIAPDVVEYWKAIYEWKCLRANLRYTKDYYFERLSEPYDIDENPLLTNGRILKHGLSPKTLILYNEIQSKINYYLDQCIEDDGYSHPENLDSESKKKLNDAMEELAELSNPYEPNSFTPKPYIQRKVAYEILSWQKFINEKTYTVAEINDFNNLATKVYNESVSKGDPKLFSDFIRYNARFTVNPEYITMAFGKAPDPDTLDSNLYKAKLMKSAIQALVRPDSSFPVIINGKPILTRNLQRYENNMDFWISCKILDEEIEANRPKRDKAFFETIKKYFKFEKLPYLDARNQVIDKTTGQPTNDLDKALSFFEYIVEKYTQIAESNGYIPGVVDNTGRLVSFTGTHDEIKDLVTGLFTYERTFYDSIADEYVTQREPLSIFTMMLPTYAKFTNTRTQQVEDTVLYYPTRLFTKKENKDSENYMNTEFDHTQNIAEQPLESLYGNQKAYDKMRKYYGDYYDVLIDTMKYAWSLYDPEKKFNYKVPLINASNALVLSRLLSQGFENTAKFFIDSITLIQANDEYAVREDELLKGPDGRLIKTLPTRYVRSLKDPGTVSYSLMETVTLFLESALNFKNKNTIRDDIELLGQALEDLSKRVGSNKHSVDQFNAMMNRHFYQMLLGSREDLSAKSVLAEKSARAIQTLITKQMLGLNLMSASVGFGDSMLSQIQDSFGLKYATPLEGIRATWEVIYRIPAMLHNWGNPLPNNKISGLMFFLGLDGSLRNIFKYANRSLVRRRFKDFLMNPFLAGDYISRGMIITQYAMDILFYPGDGVDIEPGFYTRELLKNIMYVNGHTHKEFWNARSLNNVSLWDMLHFDRKESQIVITNNPALLRYVPYINNWLLDNATTKGQLRSALANGMNPDNDTPVWKSKISGIFVGAMRGFITQRIQNQFVAGNETVLRTPQVERKESVAHGTTKGYPTMPKIPKYTDEQRYRRASWNYETGTTNDAAGTALWRAAGTLRRKIARLCKFDFGGMKQAKFSPTELYGLRNAGIVLIMLVTMLSLWPVLHDWAASIAVPPKDREDAGMTDLSYMKDRFINDGLWALYLDDLAFRLIESLLTTMDPTTLYALIGQVTTLSSGMENTIKPLVYWGGFMLNSALGNEIDHAPSDVIKDSGAFKYYTYKERSLFYAFGPLRNLHTATSYYGLMYNLKYYVNQYGKIYPLVGYDYTKAYPKKKKVSEMDFDEQMQYYEEQALKKLDALMEGDVL